MEILEARGLLENAVIQKQKELDVFLLALSVLDDKFIAEIIAIRDAQIDADVQRLKVAEVTSERDVVIGEKAELEKQITEKDALLAERVIALPVVEKEISLPEERM